MAQTRNQARRPGRPCKAAADCRSLVIEIRVSPAEHATLTGRATAARLPLSSYMRQAGLKGRAPVPVRPADFAQAQRFAEAAARFDALAAGLLQGAPVPPLDVALLHDARDGCTLAGLHAIGARVPS